MPMPRRGPYTKHSPSVIEAAVAEVLKREGPDSSKSLNSIARDHGIPKQTLSRHVQAAKADRPIADRAGRSTKLPRKVEKALIKWLLEQNELHICPSLGKVASKVQLLAALYKKRFKGKGQGGVINWARPSIRWVRAFMHRNGFSYRKPAPYSAAKQRAACSLPVIASFMQQYAAHLQQPFGNTAQKWGDRPDRIFNADETGFQRISRFSKGIAATGQKFAYRIGSEDKESITVFACANALGAHDTRRCCMHAKNSRGLAMALPMSITVSCCQPKSFCHVKT